MGERTRELFILIVGDIIAFNVALWLTLLVRYLEVPTTERLSAHIPPFLTVSAVWLFVFFILGLYDKHTNLLKRLLANRILYAQIINVVAAAILFFVIPFGITPKTNLVIYLVISIGLLSWWRLLLVPVFSPKQQHKAILIADGKEAIELADEINHNDRYNYYFVRIIDETTLKNTPNFQEKLLRLIEKEKIELIVADSRSEAIRAFLPALFDLSFLHFAFTFLDFNRLYEDTFDRVPVSCIQYDWFISNISQSRSVIYDSVKRVIDMVGALALLFPAALLFPFTALAIKLEDKGPLFYSTTRIGQYNKLITIYKLRTKNGLDAGDRALKSTLVDTKVGKILRMSRIDELPQLINVLKGDLSFIGPRPEMPALAEVYANNFDVPRGGIDVERTVMKLSYDLYYLERRSFVLDMHIVLKTLATILMRTGT
jgi:lipopolysaccharide/colanic/teichoic acid biosynthesis glycosyltransferase